MCCITVFSSALIAYILRAAEREEGARGQSAQGLKV